MDLAYSTEKNFNNLEDARVARMRSATGMRW